MASASTSPRAHVEHDDRARLGAVRLDRALQRAEGEVLELAVDREREVAPSCAARIDSTSSTMLPEAVLDHAPAARLAARASPASASSMPSWPRVVHAGEADDVRRHLAARVVAAVLALLVDARDAERRDACRGLRAASGA